MLRIMIHCTTLAENRQKLGALRVWSGKQCNTTVGLSFLPILDCFLCHQQDLWCLTIDSQVPKVCPLYIQDGIKTLWNLTEILHSNNQLLSFKYQISTLYSLLSILIMQFKFAFVAAALASLAVAVPTPSVGSALSIGSRSTGTPQCCQHVMTSSEAATNPLVILLGPVSVVLDDVTGLVGLGCTGIDDDIW